MAYVPNMEKSLKTFINQRIKLRLYMGFKVFLPLTVNQPFFSWLARCFLDIRPRMDTIFYNGGGVAVWAVQFIGATKTKLAHYTESYAAHQGYLIKIKIF
ncbi:MAG: hypothetical protein PHU14_09725 [Methylovulum sp.]|nr:hypothetical protein [Methylovulum sp.]